MDSRIGFSWPGPENLGKVMHCNSHGLIVVTVAEMNCIGCRSAGSFKAAVNASRLVKFSSRSPGKNTFKSKFKLFGQWLREKWKLA